MSLHSWKIKNYLQALGDVEEVHDASICHVNTIVEIDCPYVLTLLQGLDREIG